MTETLGPHYSALVQALQPHIEIDEAHDLESYRRTVKRALTSFVESLIRRSGQHALPIDPWSVAPFLGVIAIHVRDDRHVSKLVPRKGGFEAYVGVPVGQTQPLELVRRDPRVRWLLAHEMGHTLFFDSSKDPPEHRGHSKTLSTGGRNRESKEEWWCDDFARVLLMPPTDVRLRLRTSGRKTPMKRLVSLADDFQVPLELVARRVLYDLGLWPWAFYFSATQVRTVVRLRRGPIKGRSLANWSFSKWLRQTGSPALQQLGAANSKLIIPQSANLGVSPSRERATLSIEVTTLEGGDSLDRLCLGEWQVTRKETQLKLPED